MLVKDFLSRIETNQMRIYIYDADMDIEKSGLIDDMLDRHKFDYTSRVYDFTITSNMIMLSITRRK